MFKIVGAQADLLHDTDLLTKMDPYLVLMNSSQRRQSAVKGSAGKHPQWQDTFDFPITGDHILRVQVWDKDTFTPDDLIGEGQRNIGAELMLPPGAPLNLEVPLTYKGKNAGVVRLQMSRAVGNQSASHPSGGSSW